MSCVPTSSFHHSEEPVWVSGCCRLPGHGVLCCHASGVRDPGSGVGRPAVLLVQGPHQTAGGGGVGMRCAAPTSISSYYDGGGVGIERGGGVQGSVAPTVQ